MKSKLRWKCSLLCLLCLLASTCADWMLHTPGGGDIASRCPCLPRAQCPRVFGESAEDFQLFGQLPICMDSREVRCCGATLSVRVSTSTGSQEALVSRAAKSVHTPLENSTMTNNASEIILSKPDVKMITATNETVETHSSRSESINSSVSSVKLLNVSTSVNSSVTSLEDDEPLEAKASEVLSVNSTQVLQLESVANSSSADLNVTEKVKLVEMLGDELGDLKKEEQRVTSETKQRDEKKQEEEVETKIEMKEVTNSEVQGELKKEEQGEIKEKKKEKSVETNIEMKGVNNGEKNGEVKKEEQGETKEKKQEESVETNIEMQGVKNVEEHSEVKTEEQGETKEKKQEESFETKVGKQGDVKEEKTVETNKELRGNGTEDLDFSGSVKSTAILNTSCTEQVEMNNSTSHPESKDVSSDQDDLIVSLESTTPPSSDKKLVEDLAGDKQNTLKVVKTNKIDENKHSLPLESIKNVSNNSTPANGSEESTELKADIDVEIDGNKTSLLLREEMKRLTHIPGISFVFPAHMEREARKKERTPFLVFPINSSTSQRELAQLDVTDTVNVAEETRVIVDISKADSPRGMNENTTQLSPDLKPSPPDKQTVKIRKFRPRLKPGLRANVKVSSNKTVEVKSADIQRSNISEPLSNTDSTPTSRPSVYSTEKQPASASMISKNTTRKPTRFYIKSRNSPIKITPPPITVLDKEINQTLLHQSKSPVIIASDKTTSSLSLRLKELRNKTLSSVQRNITQSKDDVILEDSGSERLEDIIIPDSSELIGRRQLSSRDDDNTSTTESSVSDTLTSTITSRQPPFRRRRPIALTTTSSERQTTTESPATTPVAQFIKSRTLSRRRPINTDASDTSSELPVKRGSYLVNVLIRPHHIISRQGLEMDDNNSMAVQRENNDTVKSLETEVAKSDTPIVEVQSASINVKNTAPVQQTEDIHSRSGTTEIIHSSTGLTEDIHSSTGLTEDIHSSTGLTEDIHSSTGLTEDIHSSTGLTEEIHLSTGSTKDIHSSSGTTGDMEQLHEIKATSESNGITTLSPEIVVTELTPSLLPGVTMLSPNQVKSADIVDEESLVPGIVQTVNENTSSHPLVNNEPIIPPSPTSRPPPFQRRRHPSQTARRHPSTSKESLVPEILPTASENTTSHSLVSNEPIIPHSPNSRRRPSPTARRHPSTRKEPILPDILRTANENTFSHPLVNNERVIPSSPSSRHPPSPTTRRHPSPHAEVVDQMSTPPAVTTRRAPPPSVQDEVEDVQTTTHSPHSRRRPLLSSGLNKVDDVTSPPPPRRTHSPLHEHEANEKKTIHRLPGRGSVRFGSPSPPSTTRLSPSRTSSSPTSSASSPPSPPSTTRLSPSRMSSSPTSPSSSPPSPCLHHTGRRSSRCSTPAIKELLTTITEAEKVMNKHNDTLTMLSIDAERKDIVDILLMHHKDEDEIKTEGGKSAVDEIVEKKSEDVIVKEEVTSQKAPTDVTKMQIETMQFVLPNDHDSEEPVKIVLPGDITGSESNFMEIVVPIPESRRLKPSHDDKLFIPPKEVEYGFVPSFAGAFSIIGPIPKGFVDPSVGGFQQHPSLELPTNDRFKPFVATQFKEKKDTFIEKFNTKFIPTYNTEQLEKQHQNFVIEKLQQEKQKIYENFEYGKQRVKEKLQNEKQLVEETLQYGKQKVADTLQYGKQKVVDTIQHGKQKVEETLHYGKQKVVGTIQHGKQKVEETLQHGKQKVAETLQHGQQIVEEKLQHGKQKVAETLQHGKQKVAETLQHGQQIVEETLHYGKNKVQETLNHGKEDIENTFQFIDHQAELHRQRLVLKKQNKHSSIIL